jgi:hypothetical protein
MAVLGANRPVRLVATVAAALVLGVAAHGVCQAIEHHDAVKDAVALCAAAFALVTTVRLAGRRTRRVRLELPRWAVGPVLLPAGTDAPNRTTSAAWLQRFRN